MSIIMTTSNFVLYRIYRRRCIWVVFVCLVCFNEYAGYGCAIIHFMLVFSSFLFFLFWVALLSGVFLFSFLLSFSWLASSSLLKMGLERDIHTDG
jgi:hypothetical protein